MTNDYPIFSLEQPEIATRRKDSPRRIPLPPEVLSRRKQIASKLKGQVEPLSKKLKQLSEEERKAIFLKIEHERPVSLSGLKPVAESTERFTLAIPRTDNLDKLSKKIDQFGTGAIDSKGFPPNEYLAAVKTIEQGQPKDRLCQQFFDRYDELVQEDWIICEIEMMSLERGKNQQRDELQKIRSQLEQFFASGTKGTLFEHEEIKGTCRAVIRCSGGAFKQLVEEKEWQTKIFWFDERPEFETFHSTLRNFDITKLGDIISPDEDAPIVCIVDSGVTVGNPFLTPVVREDLCKSFLVSSDNPYDEHGHGSGVASLASYYALNGYPGAENKGKIWIASAKVLNKDNDIEDLNDGDEPENLRLFSKVLTEVVEAFVPHGVRIFNLSVGIPNQKWNAESKRTVPRRSWIARTIDKLSREKDIVFVISAGNILPRDVRYYYGDQNPYPKYFIDQDASILDPAQSALALTVGSLVPSTTAVGRVATSRAIAEQMQPSPFTRCGSGIGKEIKPELVDFGGNYLIEENGSVRANPGTDVFMASHQLTPAIATNSGTSFAAPRTTHKLGLIQNALKALDIGYFSSALLKALAVNSALYPREYGTFDIFKQAMSEVDKNFWFNVAGYGSADSVRATECDAYSAILFFQGEIKPNTVAYFDIPVPECLAETNRVTKRLTITVVHTPQVQRWGLERYLGTTLKWRAFRGDVEREEIIKAMSSEDDDTGNDNELPKELGFEPKVTLRSRGTVQHGIHEWKLHRTEYSSNFYTLAIAAYERWGRSNPDTVPYAAVVRLEDTSQTAPVYVEVQNIMAQAQVQSRSVN